MPKLKQYRFLAARSGAAAVLAVSIAAFGCTTNRTVGNGDPVTAPGAGVSAPATAPNTGSSAGTNPGTHAMDRLVTTKEEAMRIMAQHQQPRGVVLGPVDPVPTAYRGAEVPPTGQFGWPALATNPQVTVNSSISSPPVPAISSGAGEGIGGGAAIAAAGNAMTAAAAGMTIAPTGTASGAVFAPGSTTPTAAAIPVTPGTFAGATTVLTPAAAPALTGTTLATAATPTPTTSVAGLPPTTAASAAVVAPATTATPTRPFGGRAALLSRTASATAPLRVVTDGSGVVVTNVRTSGTTTQR